MKITELATIKIKELLEKDKANFLKIVLVGNNSIGHQVVITTENKKDFGVITISKTPEIITNVGSYPLLANTIFDFSNGDFLLIR